MKLSEAPSVKSILTVRPSAEFAGHPPWVSGLQFVYVCAVEGSACRRRLAIPKMFRIEVFMLCVESYEEGRNCFALAHLKMSQVRRKDNAHREVIIQVSE